MNFYKALVVIFLVFASCTLWGQNQIIVEEFEFNDLIPNSFYPMIPVEIYEDWNGDLVFMNAHFNGTFFARLNSNNNYSNFIPDCFACGQTFNFAVDNVDEKLVFYTGGAGTFQLKNGITSPHPAPAPFTGVAKSFFFSTNGDLWFLSELSTVGSVAMIFGENDEWVSYDKTTVGLFFSEIKILEEGPNNTIWGLKETGSVRFENDEWVQDDQVFDFPTKFIKSNQENIFVGLENGDIWKWDGNWNQVVHDLDNSSYKEMEVDSEGNIWMIGGQDDEPKIWLISGDEFYETNFDGVDDDLVEDGDYLFENLKLIIDSQDRVLVATHVGLYDEIAVFFELSLEEVSSNQESDIQYSEKIKVSPNPSKGQFQIELSSNIDMHNTIVEIRNAFGQVVYSERMEIMPKDQLINIDLANTPKGWYTVSVNTEETTMSQKVIVK